MRISVFDVFKIGIGPSSSHTVGPMKAARRFLETLQQRGLLEPGKIKTIQTDLYGSLALTGKGHCTDTAVILGLMGETPEGVDTQKVPGYLAKIEAEKRLKLAGKFDVPFLKSNIAFKKTQRLEYHSNGMEFIALDANDRPLAAEKYFSVGGGFVVSEAESKVKASAATHDRFPLEFCTAKELLDLCAANKMDIPTLMRHNELTLRSADELKAGLDKIWLVMQQCIENGLKNDGILPGSLQLARRAKSIYAGILKNPWGPMETNKFVSVWAIAVNEENAAGGKVVTAPTNGAAGIIPAVLKYYEHYYSKTFPDKYHDFLLTAAAIGILFKKGATISGAEGGCQAEVGVACSMAAAGLTQALGGTIQQVENAAEIGIEHNLGLTCDPIDGLVQIPCIERNSMGAMKAVNCCTLSLAGDGTHKVSLDSAIRTMKETGNDMKKKYKETSLGGLAKTAREEESLAEAGRKLDEKERRKAEKAEEAQEGVHHIHKRDHFMPEC